MIGLIIAAIVAVEAVLNYLDDKADKQSDADAKRSPEEILSDTKIAGSLRPTAHVSAASYRILMILHRRRQEA
jgi:hypothetical protein